MKYMKSLRVVETVIVLISIAILVLSSWNIYLDILSISLVINQGRYIDLRKIRRLIQVIFIIIGLFSIYNSDYLMSSLSFVVFLVYFDGVFEFFKRNKSLSIKNTTVSRFSKLVSLRFQWNYINLRKDWLNSSYFVLSIIIFQLYIYRLRVDITSYYILLLFLVTLVLYKITNLSSIVYINSNRNFCKKIIRLSSFVSLQDYWIVIRATLITILILILNNGIEYIETITIVFKGIVISIILRFVTIIILVKKGNFDKKITKKC